MSATVMITGAGGFIGRHCVHVARMRKHRVIAVVRSQASICTDWVDDPLIDVVVADLASDDHSHLKKAVMRADAVIHAAASLKGGDTRQACDTVIATRKLISTMNNMPREQRKLILVSSIAVYDVAAMQEGSVLDESTPIENNPDQRDAYCRNKLLQEAFAIEAAKTDKLDLFVMRPGAVFGQTRLWNSHLGHPLGPILLSFGKAGQVPVSYVEHCAKALVLAAEMPLSGIDVINITDDDLPDRATYIRALRRSGWPKIVVPVSWRIVAGLAAMCNHIPNMPGLLRSAVLKSRMMPLRYDNTKLKKKLGWQGDLSFDAAMQHAINFQGKAG
ncbi:MAG: NAD(P)-dependent oxidoreductase [Amylibacter sp.]